MIIHITTTEEQLISTFGGYKGRDIDSTAKDIAYANDFNFNNLITPSKIDKIIDLNSEDYRFVRQLENNGQKKLSKKVFDDLEVQPSEEEIAASLKRLLDKRPLIEVITGENERSATKNSDKNYYYALKALGFRKAMVNQGFDIDTVELDKSSIAINTSVLVIADPAITFSTVAVKKITQYINNGGNIFIAGEPGRQYLLNPLIKALSVQFMEGEIIQDSQNYAPTFVTATFFLSSHPNWKKSLENFLTTGIS